MPALSALLASKKNKIPTIFDADGLALDERIEFSNQNPSSFLYRILRDIEAEAVRQADVVLTRSNKAIDILVARAGAGVDSKKFHVVSNGRDSILFSPATEDMREKTRQELNIPIDAVLLVYAGSVGKQYCFPEMIEFFKICRERFQNAYLLILTASVEEAKDFIRKQPSEISQVITVRSVEPYQVPQYLGVADLGLALRQPSFSMQAVSPIKIGEYLLCGLPVIATAGIGDSIPVQDSNSIFFLDGMSGDELKMAANWFIEINRCDKSKRIMRSRRFGLSYFSLESSTEKYLSAINALKM